MGRREVGTFTANASDFMRRFGGVNKACDCAQCRAIRREGYIAGLKDERVACADIVESWKNGQRTRDDLIDRMLDEIRARKETTP
jgi:hypothetical protein